MNIKILKVGQEFKLREICEILNIKYSNNGNARNSMLKELERFIKFHKLNNGIKYIIDEVYDKPKEKADGRVNNKGGNNKKYADLMDSIIIDMVKDENILESKKKLFCNYIPLWQMNEYNKFYNCSLDTMAKNYNTTKNLVKVYYEKMLDIVRKCFENSLKRLQEQGIIMYDIGFMVLLDYGITLHFPSITRKYEKIKETEDNTLKLMGIKPYDKIVNRKINAEFRENVIMELNKNNTDSKDNIGSYWKVYNIELTDQAENIINLDDIKPNIEELRKQLIINLHNSITKHKIDGKQYYEQDKFIKGIINIDKQIWINAENIIDDENINFALKHIDMSNNSVKRIEKSDVDFWNDIIEDDDYTETIDTNIDKEDYFKELHNKLKNDIASIRITGEIEFDGLDDFTKEEYEDYEKNIA